jgi:hypothetical protein
MTDGQERLEEIRSNQEEWKRIEQLSGVAPKAWVFDLRFLLTIIEEMAEALRHSIESTGGYTWRETSKRSRKIRTRNS